MDKEQLIQLLMSQSAPQNQAPVDATQGAAGPAPVDDPNDPGVLERISRALSGGRDFAQRAFYNQTRAGLYNSATAPEDGSTYGGIGNGLAARRRLNALDAEIISRALRPDASNQ